ncbi:phosphodiester glycosidase family protein [Streptomyces sp. TRM 70351]|uniref:phosphodiester glycosidase family protein n=1 Tax=Streptomyces sp. TRM 70351 TaxID=3116552 RepID=UPI002E7B80F2|nr:phosphodiester glycosidase family protein [Streptomyces sp. TRM 70351]MEE1930544.1 phosphodiester glycosidase family protein [Streptomyces sp. TRM 70351]
MAGQRRTVRPLPWCAVALLLLGTCLVPPAASAPASGAAETAGAAGAGTAGAEPAALTATARPVAPGVTLTSFVRSSPAPSGSSRTAAPLRADALTVDLDGGARIDYLGPGAVAARRTVGELAAAHDPGPGRRTVAAVNADFFDIDATGAPLGAGLRDGRLVHSASGGGGRVAGFGPRGGGRVLELYFDGTVRLPAGSHPLAGLNAADVPAGGIGVYTARWGAADRAPATDGARYVREVAVRDGAVVSAGERPGSGPVPPGTTVLLGREAGARALAGLVPGDRVTLAYRPRPGDGGPLPRTAVGGRELLVLDGEPQDWTGAPNDTPAPRTAVGFSGDGRTAHLVTVDGRQAESAGVTLTELGRVMVRLGARNALNLDGGGSSTLLAREPGTPGLRRENAPSDGAERPVPNGLAVTAPAGGGRATGYWVRTAARPGVLPGAGRTDLVFPGLTRRLRATPHDEAYGPAPGRPPRWRSARPRVGTVDGDGTFRARRTGRAAVVAHRGRAAGSTTLRVLGALESVRTTASRLALAGRGAYGSFGVVGRDSAGTAAPVDPADVRLDYDRSRLAVVPEPERGTFSVTALTGSGTDRVSVFVAGRSTTLSVTAGLRDVTVADFSDAGRWTFAAARAEGSLGPEPEGRTGPGLRLGYDFGRSTGTRAAYAVPPGPLPVPGAPHGFTLWVRGDGHGAWPSLHLVDGHGTGHVLRGPHVEWTGWRRITFEVPGPLTPPVRVRRLYLAETRTDARYQGEVVLDELVARVPP